MLWRRSSVRETMPSWFVSADQALVTIRWLAISGDCLYWLRLAVQSFSDATHSVQQPGGQGASSGGQREFAPVLARAAVAVGVAAVFIETHPDPDHAISDGPNMISFDRLPDVVGDLIEFDRLAKERPVKLQR